MAVEAFISRVINSSFSTEEAIRVTLSFTSMVEAAIDRANILERYVFINPAENRFRLRID